LVMLLILFLCSYAISTALLGNSLRTLGVQ
jgi:hypothetical protein